MVAAIERQLSRRDVPLRENTVADALRDRARASEILALNVEDLVLDNRKAAIRSKRRTQ